MYQCYWKLLLWDFEAYHVLFWTKNPQGLPSQYHRGRTTRGDIITLSDGGRVRGVFERVPRAGRIEKIGVKRDSIRCGGVKNGKGGLYREPSDRFRPWKQEELRG